jgi:hypothetical protein
MSLMISDEYYKCYYCTECIPFSENMIIPEVYNHIYFGTTKCMDNIKLHENIKKIRIQSQYHYSLDGIVFPPNLELLAIHSSYRLSLKTIKINENCKVYFDCNDCDLIFNNLPNIKKISVGYLNKPLLNLPSDLELLEYMFDHYDMLSKSKIPFGCQVSQIFRIEY